MHRKLFVFVILALLLGATSVAAEEVDPSIFLIITDSAGYYVGGTGWEAGYVVYGSGTYQLQIYATGGEPSVHWPISDVHIVVAASEEAAGALGPPGLTSLTIDGQLITGWTPVQCPDLPPGGPFSEPDYYGYNDDYVVGGLTTTSGTKDNSKILTVEVVFSATATEASKIALLAYGTDAQGQPAKTPFSGGTTFIVPELSTLLLTLAPFAALTVYAIKRKKK